MNSNTATHGCVTLNIMYYEYVNIRLNLPKEIVYSYNYEYSVKKRLVDSLLVLFYVTVIILKFMISMLILYISKTYIILHY